MGRKCRSLTPQEFDLCKKSFGGQYASRDRALFLLMARTGFRVSEILSLRLGDVVEGDNLVEHLTVSRRYMKGQTKSREVPLHEEARNALATWIKELNEAGYQNMRDFVFQSRKGTNRAISRIQALRILQQAYRANDLRGVLGCHSARKFFAERIRAGSGNDLLAVKAALGHARIQTTMSYLDVDASRVNALILNA